MRDKAYDTNDTQSLLREREIAAVIPSRGNRKALRWCDPGVYGMRHLVANRFAALKEFRGVATRYCKRALMYGGAAQPGVGICGLARGGVGASSRRCKAIFSIVSTGPRMSGIPVYARSRFMPTGGRNADPTGSWRLRDDTAAARRELRADG